MYDHSRFSFAPPSHFPNRETGHVLLFLGGLFGSHRPGDDREEVVGLAPVPQLEVDLCEEPQHLFDLGLILVFLPPGHGHLLRPLPPNALEVGVLQLVHEDAFDGGDLEDEHVDRVVEDLENGMTQR